MKPVIETERLRLRLFAADDASRIFAIHQDDEVQKWIPNERYADVEEAREAARFFADRAAKQELPYVLAAEGKDTDELIGDAGLNAVEGRPEEVEIGFVVSRERRGKGYATELVRALTDFAVSAFSVRTLYGRVMKGNAASVRVLEKCGYTFAAEESGAEDDPYGNGMLVYRIAR